MSRRRNKKCSKDLNDTEKYSVKRICALAHLNRFAYYKWINRTPGYTAGAE